ncbi:MAG: azoR 2 [Pseudomonas sp.]|nr:azoR 2 [Pseudomonas sp.]
MPDVLMLNASPRRTSVGYRLADEMARHLAAGDSVGTVTYRDLVTEPLPALNVDYATALTRRTPADDRVFIQSERLIEEIENAQVLVIATPMHNFTVPAALKLWIDYVVRIGRTFEARPDGKVGLLADRPVYAVVSSGGFHHGPEARQPDFLTDYLSHVLATIGLADSHFVYLQGLALGSEAAAVAYDNARRDLTGHPSFAGWAETL